MFFAKVHKVGGEVLVACCDADMLGKRLREGDLELHISESFYGGENVDAKRLMEMMAEATSANLIGDKVVKLAVNEGIIEESGVLDVCGTSHAQLFNL